MPTLYLGKEPVAIIATVLAALNAVQIAAIPLPTWAHTAIVIVTVILGAVLQRAAVAPVTRVGAVAVPPPTRQADDKTGGAP